jgi:CHASE1-domain containing sensor protein
MNEARVQNAAIMTDRVVLIQEKEHEKLPGFLLYLPHFENDGNAQEGENLLGFVFSPFRSIELFNAIFSEIDMTLDVEIYAGEVPIKEELYFDYDQNHKSEGINTSRVLDLFGKKLFIHLHPLPNFPKAFSMWKMIAIFLFGTSVTIFLFWFCQLLRRQMEATGIIAEENKKLLEKSHFVLAIG